MKDPTLARWGRTALILLAIAATAQCKGGASDPMSPRPSAVSPSFDVSRVVEQVHFAYRSDGDRFTARHSTYDVAATDKSFTITPFHFPAPDTRTPLQGPAVRFETVALTAGAAAFPKVGRAQLGADGSLQITRAQVREELHNTAEGVEQRWHFQQAPAAAGPLRVVVAVAGMRYTGDSPHGLHFAGDGSGLGVRYGLGTWIDANGQRTAIVPRHVAGVIELEVPAEVVARSAFPAVLDPIISGEFGMDNPVSAPAAETQNQTAVAFDGTNFMVVWRDSRIARFYDGDVFATRVTPAGVVLDPTGIAVSTKPGLPRGEGIGVGGYDPDIAFDGSNYFVAWAEFRGGASRIVGTRLTSAGGVLDPAGIMLFSALSGGQHTPHIAFNGTNHLVVFLDQSTPTNRLFAIRVTPAGTTLDPAGIALNGMASLTVINGFEVASAGGDFLVVTSTATTVTTAVFARISGAGVQLDSPARVISTAAENQRLPTVVSDGTQYLAAWVGAGACCAGTIKSARITTAGTVLDPAGKLLLSGPGAALNPRLAFGGTEYLLAYEFSNGAPYQILGLRVSATATPIGTSFLVAPTAGLSGIGAGGGVYLVGWADSRTPSGWFGAANAAVTRVNMTGSVLDPNGILVSTSANGQRQPAAAAGPGGYLVVWEDNRSGSRVDIYGTRIGALGAVLDPAGIPIAAGAGQKYQPVVAFDGNRYLVVYVADFNGGLLGQFVDALGGVIGSPFSIVPAGTRLQSPAVAFNGTDYYVAYEAEVSEGTFQVAGRKVTVAAAVDPASVFSVGNQPALASDGAGWLIAWHQGATLRAARISAAAAVIDAGGFAITTSTAAEAPAVAFGAGNYLVVWSDKVTDPAGDIRGVRIAPSGVVVDATPIAIAQLAGTQLEPDVTYDGAQFLVAWRDSRVEGGTSSDLYAAEVSPGGVVAVPGGFAVSTELFDERLPALASGGGRTLIAYERFDSNVTFQADRVRARLVGAAACTPDNVVACGGKNCGSVMNNCGDTVSCGTCAAPDSCGGGGSPNVCGCAPDNAAACTGKSCGSVVNNCGQSVSCGTCAAPASCGGGGSPNVCGGGCIPNNVAACTGKNCGSVVNNCGQSVSCGTCTAPASCGGAGTPNVCGRVCVPSNAAACAGKNCGVVVNNCGQSVSCGTCTAPASCGGAGTPNVCGRACVPNNAAACAGKTCGVAVNNCGQSVTCGTCSAPKTCGGSGVPFLCGLPGTCDPIHFGCGGGKVFICDKGKTECVFPLVAVARLKKGATPGRCR